MCLSACEQPRFMYVWTVDNNPETYISPIFRFFFNAPFRDCQHTPHPTLYPTTRTAPFTQCVNPNQKKQGTDYLSHVNPADVWTPLWKGVEKYFLNFLSTFQHPQ